MVGFSSPSLFPPRKREAVTQGGTRRIDNLKRRRRGGKTGKCRKVGVKRKWRVLAQPTYSPQGNGRELSRVEPLNQGIDHLMRRRTQGAYIVKGWEDKQDQGCIPDTFT